MALEDSLLTESRNTRSAAIDTFSAAEIVRLMTEEDARVVEAVRAEAPAIARKGFTITAKLRADEEHRKGVIVAQGGSALGYVLLLADGRRPRFIVRTPAGVSRITGPSLETGDHTIVARLDKTGRLTLDIDGNAAAEPVQGHLIPRMPGEGLQVGRDENASVGGYASPHPYEGAIHSVVIEIDEN